MFLHGMTLFWICNICLLIRNLRIPLILISQVAINFVQEKKRKHNKKAKEAAEGKTELEGIAEGDEKQPLLGDKGEGSGSKDKKDDDDKMEE